MISTSLIRQLETHIRATVERVFQNEVDESVEFRLYVWGSVATGDATEVSDLDVIITYFDASLHPSLEARIEDILEAGVQVEGLSGFDPVVIHEDELPEIVADSSVDEVYCVGEDRWFSF